MSAKNIEAYVEAVRACRALEQAIKDEGADIARRTALGLAKQDAKLAYAKLAGREAWQAQRLLGRVEAPAVNPRGN